MKKVMILTLAAVAFSFATPQVAKAIQVNNQMTIVDDKDDKYKEVKNEELPEAVTKSISNAYTGYKIDKAYKAEDNSYKVKVAMGDLKYNLFYNANGELIKVEDPATSKDAKTDAKWGTEPVNKSLNPAKKNEMPNTPTPARESTTPPVK